MPSAPRRLNWRSRDARNCAVRYLSRPMTNNIPCGGIKRVATLDDLVERDKNHECGGFGAARVCVRVEAVAELPSRFGRFRILAFWNNRDGKEHVALGHGDVMGADDVPTRLHSQCLTRDAPGALRCRCPHQPDI